MSAPDHGSYSARKALGEPATGITHFRKPKSLLPGRLLVRRSAEEVQIPEKSGYLGILHGHAP